MPAVRKVRASQVSKPARLLALLLLALLLGRCAQPLPPTQAGEPAQTLPSVPPPPGAPESSENYSTKAKPSQDSATDYSQDAQAYSLRAAALKAQARAILQPPPNGSEKSTPTAPP